MASEKHVAQQHSMVPLGGAMTADRQINQHQHQHHHRHRHHCTNDFADANEVTTGLPSKFRGRNSHCHLTISIAAAAVSAQPISVALPLACPMHSEQGTDSMATVSSVADAIHDLNNMLVVAASWVTVVKEGKYTEALREGIQQFTMDATICLSSLESSLNAPEVSNAEAGLKEHAALKDRYAELHPLVGNMMKPSRGLKRNASDPIPNPREPNLNEHTVPELRGSLSVGSDCPDTLPPVEFPDTLPHDDFPGPEEFPDTQPPVEID
eukprot:9474318-Pyramimonas_sp.AAC.1